MAMLWCIYELILVFIYFFIYQSFVLRIKSLLLCIKRNSFLTRKTCFMKNEHAFYHRKSIISKFKKLNISLYNFKISNET